MNKALFVAVLVSLAALSACGKKEVPAASEVQKEAPKLKAEEGKNPWGQALGNSNTTSKLAGKKSPGAEEQSQ